MRKNGIINAEGKMLSSGIKFIVLGNEYVENLNKLKVTCTYDWYLLVKLLVQAICKLSLVHISNASGILKIKINKRNFKSSPPGRKWQE